MEKMEVAPKTISGFSLWKIKHKKKIEQSVIKLLHIIAIWVIIHTYLASCQGLRYDIKDFNCVDFTAEMGSVFYKLGIASHQVVGRDIKTNRYHSWVGVYFFGHLIHIEPQLLKPFIAEWSYDKISVNPRVLT